MVPGEFSKVPAIVLATPEDPRVEIAIVLVVLDKLSVEIVVLMVSDELEVVPDIVLMVPAELGAAFVSVVVPALVSIPAELEEEFVVLLIVTVEVPAAEVLTDVGLEESASDDLVPPVAKSEVPIEAIPTEVVLKESSFEDLVIVSLEDLVVLTIPVDLVDVAFAPTELVEVLLDLLLGEQVVLIVPKLVEVAREESVDKVIALEESTEVVIGVLEEGTEVGIAELGESVLLDANVDTVPDDVKVPELATFEPPTA